MAEKLQLDLNKVHFSIPDNGMATTVSNPVKKEETLIGSELSPEKKDSSTIDISLSSDEPKLAEYGIDLNKPFKITKEMVAKMRAKGKKGFWESLKDNAKNAIPFLSGFFDIKKSIDLVALANKQKRGETLSKQEKETLYLYLLEQVENEQRGSSFMGKVGEMLSHLPAFAGEFLLTGGLYSLGKNLAGKAVKKLVGDVAKNQLLKRAAIGVTGMAAGAAFRTFALSNTYSGMFARRLKMDTSKLDENGLGEIELKETDESVGASIGKGLLDGYIEAFSEQTGEFFGYALTKPLAKIPYLGKVLVPSAKAQGFMAKTGFNGLFEEYAEERLGGTLRAITGLDERENVSFAEKLYDAIIPEWEQTGVELTTTALWGGALHGMHTVGSQISQTKKRKGIERYYAIVNLLQNAQNLELETNPEDGLIADFRDILKARKAIASQQIEIPAEIKAKIKECIEKYGTAIGVDINESSSEQIQLIENELKLWQEASKKYNVCIPDAVLLSAFLGELKDLRVGALAFWGGNFIANYSQQPVKSEYIPAIMRHEMIHLNTDEKKLKAAWEKIEEIMPKNEIEKKFLDMNSQEEISLKNKIIDIDNCKYIEELVKAEINPVLIQYAYTSPEEFLAVAMMGNANAYSEEFKAFLLEIGAPKAAFDFYKNPPTPMSQAEIDRKVSLVKKAYKQRIEKDGEDKYLLSPSIVNLLILADDTMASQKNLLAESFNIRKISLEEVDKFIDELNLLVQQGKMQEEDREFAFSQTLKIYDIVSRHEFLSSTVLDLIDVYRIMEAMNFVHSKPQKTIILETEVNNPELYDENAVRKDVRALLDIVGDKCLQNMEKEVNTSVNVEEKLSGMVFTDKITEMLDALYKKVDNLLKSEIKFNVQTFENVMHNGRALSLDVLDRIELVETNHKFETKDIIDSNMITLELLRDAKIKEAVLNYHKEYVSLEHVKINGEKVELPVNVKDAIERLESGKKLLSFEEHAITDILKDEEYWQKNNPEVLERINRVIENSSSKLNALAQIAEAVRQKINYSGNMLLHDHYILRLLDRNLLTLYGQEGNALSPYESTTRIINELTAKLNSKPWSEKETQRMVEISGIFERDIKIIIEKTNGKTVLKSIMD
ncbi:MAG: hypothetical protein K6A44_07000 [bacterium]|nr:hypothetical protein [bacterium]